MIFQIEKTKIQFVQFFDMHEKAAEAIAEAKTVGLVDLAFTADSDKSTFAGTTAKAMELIGNKLVAWVDHHKNVRWPEFSDDPRYHLAEAPSCPRLVEIWKSHYDSALIQGKE